MVGIKKYIICDLSWLYNFKLVGSSSYSLNTGFFITLWLATFFKPHVCGQENPGVVQVFAIEFVTFAIEFAIVLCYW